MFTHQTSPTGCSAVECAACSAWYAKVQTLRGIQNRKLWISGAWKINFEFIISLCVLILFPRPEEITSILDVTLSTQLQSKDVSISPWNSTIWRRKCAAVAPRFRWYKDRKLILRDATVRTPVFELFLWIELKQSMEHRWRMKPVTPFEAWKHMRLYQYFKIDLMDLRAFDKNIYVFLVKLRWKRISW